MTIEELDAHYKAANWLIAKRSAAAAGKALIFSAGSLSDAAKEIAAIYGLSDEEEARLQRTNANNALLNVQTAAGGLFGETMGLSTAQAMSIAKTAVASGQKVKVVQAMIRAGPNAAKAVVAGGRVAGKTASSAAGKGTPWGWIATAAYAAGTGSWFAYKLRAFNLAAYEIARLRENIDLPLKRTHDQDMVSMEAYQPVLSTISARASAVGARAGAVWDGAVDAGGCLADATGRLINKITSRQRKSGASDA